MCTGLLSCPDTFGIDEYRSLARQAVEREEAQRHYRATHHTTTMPLNLHSLQQPGLFGTTDHKRFYQMLQNAAILRNSASLGMKMLSCGLIFLSAVS